MEWRLYNFRNGKSYEPLEYSNNKNQADLVAELLEALDDFDLVFLKGGTGTGKSAIALQIIYEFGRGCIATPTKALEQQYREDYYLSDRGILRKGILCQDGTPFNIEGIRGRANFTCPHDGDVDCSYRGLPCRLPTGNKTRLEIAKNCSYYSPIVPEDAEDKFVEELGGTPLRYESVSGDKVLINRSRNCPYYGQYKSFTKNNLAVIMNSTLWSLITMMGRKAKFPVEIIDEGDAFLDGLTYRTTISRKNLKDVYDSYGEDIEVVKEIYNIFHEIIINDGGDGEKDGYRGKATKFDDLIKALYDLYEKTEEFQKIPVIYQYLNEAYAEVKRSSVNNNWDSITFYIPEPSIILDKLLKKSGKLVLMSATFQDDNVLKDVYGLHDYQTVQGQVENPGTIYLKQSGKELSVNNKKWQNEKFRSWYFYVRDYLLSNSKPPVLAHKWGNKYLEGLDYNEEELRNRNPLENGEKLAISTVSVRGKDFSDDKCRTIFLFKCPYPDMSDPVLQTMYHKFGQSFWSYYRDMMVRTLLQMVGRGVRNEGDWVEVRSPDHNVFKFLQKFWEGRKE